MVQKSAWYFYYLVYVVFSTCYLLVLGAQMVEDMKQIWVCNNGEVWQLIRRMIVYEIRTATSLYEKVEGFVCLFGEAFCLLTKKAKALTNNFKHKILKITFTFMSQQNTFLTKNKKASSKNLYQTNPKLFCNLAQIYWKHLSISSSLHLFTLKEWVKGDVTVQSLLGRV